MAACFNKLSALWRWFGFEPPGGGGRRHTSAGEQISTQQLFPSRGFMSVLCLSLLHLFCFFCNIPIVSREGDVTSCSVSFCLSRTAVFWFRSAGRRARSSRLVGSVENPLSSRAATNRPIRLRHVTSAGSRSAQHSSSPQIPSLWLNIDAASRLRCC